MPDIKLVQANDGTYDFDIENGDLKNEDGLDTQILVSLLTDARAPADKVLKPENRRGWIGNLESLVPGRDLGGLLWLVEQRRLNQDTLNESIDYARQSLDWMVQDGLAVSVDVTGEIVPLSGIALTIKINVQNGITETRYVQLWEVTGNAS